MTPEMEMTSEFEVRFDSSHDADVIEELLREELATHGCARIEVARDVSHGISGVEIALIFTAVVLGQTVANAWRDELTALVRGAERTTRASLRLILR